MICCIADVQFLFQSTFVFSLLWKILYFHKISATYKSKLCKRKNLTLSCQLYHFLCHFLSENPSIKIDLTHRQRKKGVTPQTLNNGHFFAMQALIYSTLALHAILVHTAQWSLVSFKFKCPVHASKYNKIRKLRIVGQSCLDFVNWSFNPPIFFSLSNGHGWELRSNLELVSYSNIQAKKRHQHASLWTVYLAVHLIVSKYRHTISKIYNFLADLRWSLAVASCF